MVNHTNAFLEKQKRRREEEALKRKKREEEGFNNGLRKARAAKNDEFFTQSYDIEKELSNYSHHFKGKTVLCNCNDSQHTGFKDYFVENFNAFGLKRLICTGYKVDGQHGDVYEYDGNEEKTSILSGNGSFDSEECIRLLNKSDIVVTNPPFSLFRQFLSLLVEHDKVFLIIGNLNAVAYKEVFPLMRDNLIWMGETQFYGGTAYFIAPMELYDASKMSKKANGQIDENGNFIWRVNGVRWFTNMHNRKRDKELVLTCKYEPDKYPKYDNYDAINVDKVLEIPNDYDGLMGVPVSFMDKYCPEQFEIIGLMTGAQDKAFINGNDGRTKFFVNGKSVYARILIKKKR